MEKAINLLLEKWVKGVDTYTHNKSTWLIFGETKQWVIELTDTKTLWYNYNFFKQIFDLLSLDVVENQHYITKWVEDNIINKELTYATLFRDARDRKQQFEDALENGVRHTEDMVTNIFVDDTLENGVKETNRVDVAKKFFDNKMDGTIENGVKNTDYWGDKRTLSVEGTLENGVKKTKSAVMKTDWSVEDTIQNGVKETISTLRRTLLGVDDIIQNGIKETRLEMNITEGEVDDIIQDGVRDTQSNPYENKSWIEGVIKKGVRHTLNTEYMPTSMVEDIIQSGVKHTEYGDWLDGDERLDDIVENGVKETNPVDVMKFFDNKMEDALQNGVKETKISPTHTEYGDWLDGDERLDEIIKNGVKKTISGLYIPGAEMDAEHIIKNGEKINGTYAGGQRQSEKCKSVVEYGTKNPTD